MGDMLPFLKPDDLPDAPPHLSEESKQIWKEIHRRWVLDVDANLLLRGALESWDTYTVAQEILMKEGPTVQNRESGMVRVHPASLVARDSLKSFRLLMKDLQLDPNEAAR